jgi:hypothetical protein
VLLLALASAAFSVLAINMAIVIGPTPPGTGVNAPAVDFHGIEIDIANELAGAQVLIFDPVDADIDDSRAWLHPIRANHLRTTDCGNQNVGAAGQASDIFGATMSNGDGGVCGQEQMADRPANNG